MIQKNSFKIWVSYKKRGLLKLRYLTMMSSLCQTIRPKVWLFMAYHWKSRKNPTAHVQNSGLLAVKSSPLNSAMEKSACTMSVPMIRSHKWEWGPPIPQHHPALQCPHYTMHLQTQLILRNLTGPSQLTSHLPSPYQTAPTPWTTDFAASFLNPVILSLLCQQCQGKGVLCTNARCLSQTSPSHHKASSRSTTTQSMNIPPWLAVQPAKAFPLLWWSNRNPETLHMIQKCLAATPFIWGKKASWLIQAEQKAACLRRVPGSSMMTPVSSRRSSMGILSKSQECTGKVPRTRGEDRFSSGSFW